MACLERLEQMLKELDESEVDYLSDFIIKVGMDACGGFLFFKSFTQKRPPTSLIKKGYVERRGREWWLTSKGKEFVLLLQTALLIMAQLSE